MDRDKLQRLIDRIVEGPPRVSRSSLKPPVELHKHDLDLPEVSRTRLKELAEYLDVPEVVALRISIALAYRQFVEVDPEGVE